ncbi:MAG: beta-ketoacyl synthase N-terminal-like domain-containing protein, partial [Xenophilus sp.]
MGEPVLVTGIGLVTPLGDTLADFDAALMSGRSAIGMRALAIDGLDACEVPAAACADFDEGAQRSPSGVQPDRGTAMALRAARRAFSAAGLEGADGGVAPERLGIYWGCGMGGAASFDQATQSLYVRRRRLRPTTVLTTMPNAAAAELSLALAARGASLGYACACASSAVAIGEAMRALRGGWIDVAVAGGHEALLTPGVMAGWQAMRVLAPGPASRPFAA